MASKPFPFSVCKECCTGGGTVETDSLNYKGSLESTSFLPAAPSTGDMYNIETESTISVKGTEYVTRYLISCEGDIHTDTGAFVGTYDSMYDSWLDNPSEIELFDSKGNSHGVYSVMIAQNGEIQTFDGIGLEVGTDIAYFQLPNQDNNESASCDNILTVYETIEIPIMPKQKVFYNGSEWDVFAGNLSKYATKEAVEAIESRLSAVYRAKGSKDYSSDLPIEGNEIGDVWNIKNDCKNTFSAMPVTVTSVDTGYISDGGFVILYIQNISTEIYDGSSTLEGNLYDTDGEYLSWAEVLANGVLRVSTDLANLEVGNYYLEFTSEEYTQYNTVAFLEVKAGENVVWTESGWDNLGGVYNLSVYATKEEIGEIEAALNEIEALQNSYIGGDSV